MSDYRGKKCGDCCGYQIDSGGDGFCEIIEEALTELFNNNIEIVFGAKKDNPPKFSIMKIKDFFGELKASIEICEETSACSWFEEADEDY
jgi:hypothetical protein